MRSVCDNERKNKREKRMRKKYHVTLIRFESTSSVFLVRRHHHKDEEAELWNGGQAWASMSNICLYE